MLRGDSSFKYGAPLLVVSFEEVDCFECAVVLEAETDEHSIVEVFGDQGELVVDGFEGFVIVGVGLLAACLVVVCCVLERYGKSVEVETGGIVEAFGFGGFFEGCVGCGEIFFCLFEEVGFFGGEGFVYYYPVPFYGVNAAGGFVLGEG